MKLYIGCSLTQAPEEFKLQIENLKSLLRKKYEILDFIGLTTGTPKDVYELDIQKYLVGCDVFIAICDYPAIGLGYELGMSIEHLRKPTLALARDNVKITRLLSGITQKHYRLSRYKTIEEIPVLIDAFVEDLAA